MSTKSRLLLLQNASTVDGNGLPATVEDYLACQMVEIIETGGGTCTINLKGSNDAGTNRYQVGYQRVDDTTTPARSKAAISVSANTAHVYQVLDPYMQIEAIQSSTAGGCVLTVRAYIARSY